MKGFKGGSDWALNPSQADEVSKFMEERLKVTERISF
jgi:hypothetical protein